MEAFCGGSPAAFETLFERHAAGVRALVLRLTGDRTLANDITQAAFLSIIGGRNRFVAGSRFKPWLYAIAMNALRDHWRRARREILSDDGGLPEGFYEPLARDGGLERQVDAALAGLPAEQREAVVLHHIAGFSFSEIALMVGASQSAIKVRAHRGYQRIRAITQGLWKEQS